MSVKIRTEHILEFLSLKGGCTGLSESTHVKMPHCWKSHVTAQSCTCIITKQVEISKCLFVVVFSVVVYGCGVICACFSSESR